VPTVRDSTGELFGLLLLDKPAGLSSNRALQRVRRLVGAAKAGHGGSLDPLATGMLPIFLGAATRLTTYLLAARKTYRVTATLGTATATGDAEGEVTIDRSSGPPPPPAQIAAALAAHTGEIEQVPPMFSALKRDGVPLYRLARAGLEVPREPRRVVIDALTLESYAWPALTFTVRCSKGTYVRTLVEDIAKRAGTVGHVASLRRLGVEPFAERDMQTLDALEEAARAGAEALERLLVPADAALVGWTAARLTAADAVRLRQGQTVALPTPVPVGLVKVFGPEDQLIAIATATGDGRLRPQRVLVR
jgi:tRNA pseudouridine55 synthase